MSMISHQIDELRELAKGLRMLDYPKDAQKVDSAIDTIEALSEKVADQNLNRSEIPKSENPCGKCQMSLMEKSTCCGCPERIEWEKQYKQNIPSATSQNLKETNKNCEVDLISRQAAIDAAIENDGDLDAQTNAIDKLPSADRPTGKWIVKHGSHECIRTSWYACDQCGGAGDISDKFCKHCGTKMG